jgi:UMF1 family MFS transporter
MSAITKPRQPISKSQWGWILYDLANTIFALGVVGLYLPAWLKSEGLRDSALALTAALAGITVIALAPLVGAHSDRSGRRLPALGFTTAVAIGATAGLASFPPVVTLLLLGLGLVGLNVGASLYDALLGDVAKPEERGRISGLGVGIGYVGSFIGLGLGRLSFEVFDAGYAATFLFLAVGFLLFSVPLFLWLHEPKARKAMGPEMATRFSPLGLIESWKAASRTPGVVRFLVGRFLYTDAINTLIGGFLTIFVLTELNLDTGQVNNLLALAILTAILGGIGGGRVVQRIGARATLRVTLLAWVVAILLGVVAAAADSIGVIWVVGGIGGLALGGTWTADRVLMLELSPPERLGEFYGLYATVGRFATIIGPLAWALVVDALGWGRSAAMLVLASFVLAGFFVIKGSPSRDFDKAS